MKNLTFLALSAAAMALFPMAVSAHPQRDRVVIIRESDRFRDRNWNNYRREYVADRYYRDYDRRRYYEYENRRIYQNRPSVNIDLSFGL
ncbi:hypothetical protein Syn7502_02451 [Synechococcus sp. PCC 7502]|uniref:hypothetical protein n=1 Tax=Synechococcus sp. PCC 7502 TaxID=1173263 RepID=UPI00029FECCB|nr:hypothetical protein [Synechococcus sp. PCC 7502]AFY74432.1 hypothetical protein Syn7502_02451 [Synechococcus sp. PCC 7502]